MDEIDLNLEKDFSFLGKELLAEIKKSALIKNFPEGAEIMREGQYIRVIPIVIKGLIKVFSRYEDKELLLYYIEPFQSCIMSFSSALSSEPSRIFAISEEETLTMLLPVEKVNAWIKQFPELNTLFFNQYNIRYNELLETIRHMLYFNLDTRVYEYLIEKSRLKGSKNLNLKHKQIANELGTAREVVSRVMKKLEKEGKIDQNGGIIEIL